MMDFKNPANMSAAEKQLARVHDRIEALTPEQVAASLERNAFYQHAIKQPPKRRAS